jgi:hypothetical protein
LYHIILQIKVSIAQVGSIRSGITAADETALQDVITDVVVNALRGATVHLNLGQYPSCPRFDRYKQTPGSVLPLHYDSMVSARNKLHIVFWCMYTRGQ